MHNHEIVNVISLVSQIREVVKILPNYFEQNEVPKETIEQLNVIHNKLNILFEYLTDKSDKTLDEATIEEIRYQSLKRWKQSFDELMILLEYITKTIPLSRMEEIQWFVEKLKLFSAVEVKN